LVDKVYQPKNLRAAWERVKANRGSGGVDGQSLEAFEQGLDDNLQRLHEELRTDGYQPQPVRRVNIPKAGKPGEWRPLGIPAVFDRVCQQALLQRLEPIFEPLFDDSSFGYRRGRSAKDALRKIWREIEAGAEWIVDADLKDRYKDSVRRKTRRRIPLPTAQLIHDLNPVIRGWGDYYKRAHVRRLFNQLDRWVVRRLWAHHHRRWRCAGWRTLPTRRLRGELGLVSLVSLIPSLRSRPRAAPW
jgi:hypothetical protein